MKIKRTVGNKEMEFELTGAELYDAYQEEQHIFDKDDILNWIWDCDDEYFAEQGVTKKAMEDFSDAMADEMRRYIDKYDNTWGYARDEAIAWGIRILREGTA